MMPAASSTSQVQSESATLLAEQLFITHCAPADVFSQGNGGFAVRASSTREASLVRFAFEYPPYELPLEQWTSTPRPANAPRRLAFVSGPDGRAALIHSAYVEEDTTGRKSSYFTHVLLYRTLTVVQALQTWDSQDWLLNYPPGADKHLQPFVGLPRPGTVNDQAVTAFLAGWARGPEQNLATVVTPDRLRDNPAHRRNLVRWAIQGVLLVMAGGNRERLYLHAEPGLSALVLYAAVRLLPPSAIQALRFSTYEPAHGVLRQFKLGQVAGTYAPQKGLESEYFTRRGYALDSLGQAGCSAELRQSAPVIEELIDLAAKGQWCDINEIHRLCTTGAPTAVLSDAVEMLGAMRRIPAGKAQIEDLLLLIRFASGREIIQQYEELVLPAIRIASLTNANLRAAFKDWLVVQGRLAKLLEWSVKALEEGDIVQWQQRWDLLKYLADMDNQRLRTWLLESLTRIAPRGTLEAHRGRVRLPVLKEWQAVNAPGSALPPLVGGLLIPRTSAELGEVVQQGFRPEWLLYALRASLSVPATAETAVRVLRSADDHLLAAFCDEVNRIPGHGDQLAILIPFLSPGDPEAPSFYNRLVATGLKLADSTHHALLEKVKAYEESWLDFWVDGNHLVNLLVRVNGWSESHRVWQAFSGTLNLSVVLEHSNSRRLFNCLQKACEALKDKMPRQCAEEIAEWALLCDFFSGNFALSPSSLDPTILCDRRGVEPADLLKLYFCQSVQKLLPDQQPGDQTIEPLHAIFSVFHPAPAPDEMEGHHTTFGHWLDIISECKNHKTLAHFQVYYLTHYVPLALRRMLAEKFKTAGRLRKEAYKYIVTVKPPVVQTNTTLKMIHVPAPPQPEVLASSATIPDSDTIFERILAVLEKRPLVSLVSGVAIGTVLTLLAVFLWGLVHRLGERTRGPNVAVDSRPILSDVNGLEEEFKFVKGKIPEGSTGDIAAEVTKQTDRITRLRKTIGELDSSKPGYVDEWKNVLEILKSARETNHHIEELVVGIRLANEMKTAVDNEMKLAVATLEYDLSHAPKELRVKWASLKVRLDQQRQRKNGPALEEIRKVVQEAIQVLKDAAASADKRKKAQTKATISHLSDLKTKNIQALQGWLKRGH